MFIDSVILYGLVRELKELLLSAQVKQIHQTDPRVIDMELYRPTSSPAHLILCAQNPPCLYAVCGGKKRQQYIDSQTFCMTLRKIWKAAAFLRHPSDPDGPDRLSVL